MAQKKKRSPAQGKRSGVIINILTLIVLVLLVFEGKSLISLFSRVDIQEMIRQQEEEVFASANLSKPEEETDKEKTDTAASDPASDKKTEESEASTEAAAPQHPENTQPAANDKSREIGIPDGCQDYLSCIVPAQSKPVFDTYFQDAVFIGDSRMEGFRNFSGISGTNFVTAVGMQLENFYTDAQIATAKGSVTVLQALRSMNFSKIYMMIGTNELGAYDMEQVRLQYEKVLSDVKACSSSKTPEVYIFSVIYVDEYLTETDYVNNANVDLVNAEILKMCKENDYHYINLNEVLSDGVQHSLLQGASEDGVHLTAEYCAEWLNYTKTHYLPSV